MGEHTAGDRFPATPVRPTPDNTIGLLALVLGAVSFVAGGFLLGIPAIVLGVKGRRRADHGLASNRDQATVGMVCGIVSTATSAIAMVVIALLLLFVTAWPGHGSSSSSGGSTPVLYRATGPDPISIQEQALRYLGDSGRSVTDLQCDPLPSLGRGNQTHCTGTTDQAVAVQLRVTVLDSHGDLGFDDE
ncbi:DUF4190 domain-containing protein [Oryzihumus sp.]